MRKLNPLAWLHRRASKGSTTPDLPGLLTELDSKELYSSADVEKLREVVGRCRARVSKVIIDKLKLRLERDRLQAEVKALTHGSVKEEVFDIVCKERDQLREQLDRAIRVIGAADALEREAFKKGTAGVGAGLFRGLRVLIDQYQSAVNKDKPHG